MCDMQIPFAEVERQVEIADKLKRFACLIENEEKADEIGMRATEIRTLLASNRICEEWSKYIWAV